MKAAKFPGLLSRTTWEGVLEFLSPESVLFGRAIPVIAASHPRLRELLQRRPAGVTIGGHTVRLTVEGDDGDDLDEDDDEDDHYCEEPFAGAGESHAAGSGGAAKRNAAGQGSFVTPQKVPTALRSHASSSYANDHCKLRLLDGAGHETHPASSGSAHLHDGGEFPFQQPPHVASRLAAPGRVGRSNPYSVSVSLSVVDSVHGEHQRSLWWIERLVREYGLNLRHAGFRGRGVHTDYVLTVIRGVHEANGSLLSLELSGMWFFTVFLDTIATTTDLLVELESLALEDCHVFPVMEETIGELVSHLPSLQRLTLHQFDFSVGRAKQILEATSEHPCLRHININDNLFRTNAQGVVLSNVQSIRRLESFHMNHLPVDFWTFGDFFAYKTGLRVLQLSGAQLNDIAARDLGHCFNVAVMLEEIHLSHCGIDAHLMELIFPVIRRGQSDGTPLATSSPLVPPQGFGRSFGASGSSSGGGMVEDDGSRNTSPVPKPANVGVDNAGATGSHIAGGGGPHPGVHVASVPSVAGLGVNPFFQPPQSPLQLASMVGVPAVGPVPGILSPYSAAGRFGASYSSLTICASLPHLRVLNLSENPIGIGGLLQLSAPLSRMDSLEQLFLAGCQLSGEGLAEALGSTLSPVIGGLFVLDLSRNMIGDAVMVELCRIHLLEKLASNVAEVFLSDVGISRVGLVALMGELQYAEWLSLIDVSVNRWEAPFSRTSNGAASGGHVDPNAPVTLAGGISAASSTDFQSRTVVEAFECLLGSFQRPVPSALQQVKLNFCDVPVPILVSALRNISANVHAHGGVGEASAPAPLEVLQLASLKPSPDNGAVFPLLLHLVCELYGRHLVVLDVSRNALGDEVVTDLLLCRCSSDGENPQAPLGQCISCQLSRVATLHLRKTSFSALSLEHDSGSQQQQQQLVDSQKVYTGLVSLTELDLSGNAIDQQAFRGLAERFLRHLSLLQRLDVSQNEILKASPELLQRYPLQRTSSPRSAADRTKDEQAAQPAAASVPQDPGAVAPRGGKDSSTEEVVAVPTKSDRRTATTALSSSSDTLLSADALHFVSSLRKRRFCIVDELMKSLRIGLQKCRGSLRRLKLDANGLSSLATAVDITQPDAAPASAEINVLLGPLGPQDWRQANSLLPDGQSWDTFTLFSLHVTSS